MDRIGPGSGGKCCGSGGHAIARRLLECVYFLWFFSLQQPLLQHAPPSQQLTLVVAKLGPIARTAIATIVRMLVMILFTVILL